MLRRILLGWVLVLVNVALLASPLKAEPPWKSLVPIKRASAKRSQRITKPQSYDLTEQHGPWMIFVASYKGEGALQESMALVKELRQTFRAPSYVHRKTYDFSKSVTGLGLDKYGDPRKMRYANAANYDEVAVLIGNFPTVDDPKLRKLLNRIKTTHPKCLKNIDPHDTTLTMASMRLRSGFSNKKNKRGPLSKAFVTRNPMLPQEYFAPTGLSKELVAMNKSFKHSLLTCPAKYTVRIAKFRGSVIIDQEKVNQVERGGRMDSRLREAGLKAHRLTKLLRERGVEAYEFHDRHESLVTVGSFDSVGTPRHDGKIEMHPGILKLIEQYGPEKKAMSNGRAGLQPKSLGGITMDVQPVPVEVPRRSIAADYARF